MSMKEVLTSFEGRIGRQTFWFATFLMMVMATIFGGIIVALFGTRLPSPHLTYGYAVSYDIGALGAALMAVLGLVYMFCALAIAIKRWHDRGKSGWWVLIALVPVIGGLWVLIETGFLKGTTGPNRYGDDPVRL